MDSITQTATSTAPKIWVQSGVKTANMTAVDGEPTLNSLYNIIKGAAIKRTTKSEALYFIAGSMVEGKRSNDNLTSRTLVPIDVDEFPAGVTIDDVVTNVAKAGHRFIAYPTPSNKPDKPRLRVVFELSEPVSRNCWDATEQAAADIVGVKSDDHMKTWAQLAGLPVTNDHSDISSVVRHDGRTLDPVTTSQPVLTTPAPAPAPATEWAWDMPKGVDPCDVVEAWARRQDLENGETWLPARLEINTAANHGYITDEQRETMIGIISGNNDAWFTHNFNARDNNEARVSFARFFRAGLPKGATPGAEQANKPQRRANPADYSDFAEINEKTGAVSFPGGNAGMIAQAVGELASAGRLTNDRGEHVVNFIKDTRTGLRLADTITKTGEKVTGQAPDPKELATVNGAVLDDYLYTLTRNGATASKIVPAVTRVTDRNKHDIAAEVLDAAKEQYKHSTWDYRRYFTEILGAENGDNEGLLDAAGAWLRATAARATSHRITAEYWLVLAGTPRTGKTSSVAALGLNIPLAVAELPGFDTEDFETGRQIRYSYVSVDNEAAAWKAASKGTKAGREATLAQMKRVVGQKTIGVQKKGIDGTTIEVPCTFAITTNHLSDLPITSAEVEKFIIINATAEGITGHAWDVLSRNIAVEPGRSYIMAELAEIDPKQLAENYTELARETMALALIDYENGHSVGISPVARDYMNDNLQENGTEDVFSDMVTAYVDRVKNDQPDAGWIDLADLLDAARGLYQEITGDYTTGDQRAELIDGIRGVVRNGVPGIKWTKRRQSGNRMMIRIEGRRGEIAHPLTAEPQGANPFNQ